MTDALNEKIIKKLNEIEGNQHVKQFIKEMLFYELGQLEEGMSRHWTNFYQKTINKHLANYIKESDESED